MSESPRPPDADDAVDYRVLLEHAADGILTIDGRMRIVAINERGCYLAGVTCEELIGRSLTDFLVPVDLAATPLRLPELGLRQIVTFERRIIRPDGEERIAEVSATRLSNDQFQVIVRDITERRTAEEQVRRSEHRFRALVEHASDVIAILDPDGTIRYASPSHRRVLGVDPVALEGQNRFSFVHPADVAPLRAQFDRALSRDGPTPPRDIRFRRADGSYATLSVTLTDMRAEPAVGGIVANSRDVSAERSANEARRQTEVIFDSAFRASRDAVVIFRLSDERILDVNDAWLATTGLTRDEVIGRSQAEFAIWGESEQARFRNILERDGFVRDFEFSFYRSDRKRGWAMLSAEIIEVEGELSVLAIGRDMTAQRELEVQLRQSQRLEALGRLAGGIAHDFNNMLAAISGFSDLAAAELPDDGQVKRDIREIQNASARAAALVRQLLAFSRQQALVPRVVDVNEIATRIEGMLRRLVGDGVSLVTALATDIGRVFADPSQLEQILINLVVNARDAMPDGGLVTIETADAYVGAGFGDQAAPMKPGRYVLVTVTDNGVGMDAQTAAQIFDPFFTTKELGRGTGLGLSTVYGIVQQSGGYIWTNSAPGAGSSFQVYLPTTDAEAEPVAPSAADPVAATVMSAPAQTVLVVDDEAMIRVVIRRVLEKQGYRVLEAKGGVDALWISAQESRPIDLLLTDVMMPGMDGRELARRYLAERPATRVLFMSGYAHDAADGTTSSVRQPQAREATDLPPTTLRKPFTTQELLHAIQGALTGGPVAR